MTNPAADARAKAQEKWPGATVAERKRNSIRHQHPTEPDRFMLDTSIGPIHYGAGEDQEIDTAWQPTTGAWDWEMTTNNWQTYARDTFNAGDIFEFAKDGEWVRFDPQSINWIDENTSRQQIAIKQAVTAQVNDDLMEFPEAYGPGRHFQYKNQPARLSKLITIDSDTDLPAVTLQGNEIWFEAEFTIAHSSGVEVYLDGVLWQKQNNVRVQTADRIEFRDEATGTTAFWWLGFPKAYDSDGDETIGQMEVRRQGGPTALFITVRIPKLWIDSAIFPIFIDPTLDTSVGASGDDGEWQDGGSFDNTTHIITMGDAFGQAWNSFTRFDNLTFSGTIDVAYATFDAEITRSNSTLNIVIRAVDTNDPAAPTTHSEADSPSAGRTTAAGNWAPGNQTAGTSYDTSSIVSVIQELLDSAYTYDGTQAIVLHFLHDGSDVWIDETSFDDPTQSAPALHIEYTAAGGDSTPYLSGLRKRRFQPQIVR